MISTALYLLIDRKFGFSLFHDTRDRVYLDDDVEPTLRGRDWLFR